jgi:DNA mismatch repair ATPase MutL
VPDSLGCCLDEVDDSEELTKGCRASELKSQEGQPLNQIDASDFTNSRVIGSFNKSFVLVRLQNGRLLAVDQHAADERVQLETLISSFKCDSHTLLEPIQLSVEPLAVEWLSPAVQKEVRRVFGFDFDVDPQGCLLIIKRLPLLGGVILKPTDLLEILERSQLTGQVVLENSPAVMSHLAMRACKSAVKLGDDVDFNRMSSLVQRLMQCRNPWVSHSLSDSTRRVHTAVLLFVSSIGIQPRPDRLLGLWR